MAEENDLEAVVEEVGTAGFVLNLYLRQSLNFSVIYSFNLPYTHKYIGKSAWVEIADKLTVLNNQAGRNVVRTRGQVRQKWIRHLKIEIND